MIFLNFHILKLDTYIYTHINVCVRVYMYNHFVVVLVLLLVCVWEFSKEYRESLWNEMDRSSERVLKEGW